MMAMPEAGFVFLATTKTGSTALQNHFGRHANVLVRNPPGLKHMNARGFHNVFAPWLNRNGFPRQSYEVMCVVREPVDWVSSWWRYRSRPGMAGQANYTGDLSFDEYAEKIIAGEVGLGTTDRFIRRANDEVGVDRIYKYEHIDEAAAWMAGKLGIKTPELKHTNVSPDRETVISEAARSKLEEFYAADMEIYANAL